MLCYEPKNRIECADAKLIVVGHWNAMMSGSFGLKNDMAAYLVDDAIIPMFAERLYKCASRKVARQLHAQARTSSRNRRKRMERGRSCGASK